MALNVLILSIMRGILLDTFAVPLRIVLAILRVFCVVIGALFLCVASGINSGQAVLSGLAFLAIAVVMTVGIQGIDRARLKSYR